MKDNLFKFLFKKSLFIKPKILPNWQYSTSQFLRLLLLFSAWGILIAPYGQGKAIAKENYVSASATSFKVTFNPPAEKRPKTSSGGASRSLGQCINQAENSALPLVPLLPAAAKGLTIASHPTVLAYLPKTSARQVFFSWSDEQNNSHYQTILPIGDREGIISLTLPEDAPPLEVGKNYQWALALMCDGRLQPDSPVIQGQIERVAIESTMSDRLKNANALETAAIYGEAGIWYETVATLAELQTTQPNDSSLTSNWQELLTSVGLEKIASTPLIGSAK